MIFEGQAVFKVNAISTLCSPATCFDLFRLDSHDNDLELTRLRTDDRAVFIFWLWPSKHTRHKYAKNTHIFTYVELLRGIFK